MPEGIFGGTTTPDPGVNAFSAQPVQPPMQLPASPDPTQSQVVPQVQPQPVQPQVQQPAPTVGQPATPGQPAPTVPTTPPTSREQLVQSLAAMAQNAGAELDLNLVATKSDQELQNEYNEALKEVGAINPVNQSQQQKLELMQQQFNAMAQYIAMMQGQGQPQLPVYGFQPQVPQQPYGLPYQQTPIPPYPQPAQPQQPRDPLGRFMSPPAQPQYPQTPQTPQIDPEKFWEQFNEKGPEALTPIIDYQVQTALAQFQPMLQEVQQLRQVVSQQQQEKQLQQHFTTQINGLRQKYGQDFDQYRTAVAKVIETKPYYAGLPNGLELAYLEAKQMASTYQPQQPGYNPQQLQNMFQQQQAAKMAAQMPGSTGYYQVPQSQQQAYNPFGAVEKKSIFTS